MTLFNMFEMVYNFIKSQGFEKSSFSDSNFPKMAITIPISGKLIQELYVEGGKILGVTDTEEIINITPSETLASVHATLVSNFPGFASLSSRKELTVNIQDEIQNELMKHLNIRVNCLSNTIELRYGLNVISSAALPREKR